MTVALLCSHNMTIGCGFLILLCRLNFWLMNVLGLAHVVNVGGSIEQVGDVTTHQLEFSRA